MPRYTTFWRSRFLKEADNIDELIEILEISTNELRGMKEAGIKLETLGNDYYVLSTHDRNIANKFGLEKEIPFRWEPEYGGEG